MNLSALDGRLLALREKAKEGRDPTAADETLAYLLNVAEARKPRKILEIGAAEGLTSCALLLCSHAHLTAIEADADRAARAREHFRAFGVEDRAVLYEGDAGEILPMMTDTFDFIFLDEPISHLDDDNGTLMGRILTKEAEQQGAGVVVTSIGKHIELEYNKVMKL